MIEEGFYNLLTTSTAITAITGTNIFPLVIPEATNIPAITYQIVASVSKPNLSSTGLTQTRMQIDCWASSYPVASQLRDALISTLDGYSGTLSNGVNLQYTQHLTSQDSFEHDSLTYRSMTEFYLYH